MRSIPLILALLGLVAPARAEPAAPGCVTFAGDVMLSRGVAQELRRRAGALWRDFHPRPSEAWVGNLEGAVADPGAQPACQNPAGLCLPIAPGDLAVLKQAPWAALSLANNHGADFSAPAATAAALRALGITPLEEETAPALLALGGQQWALVPLNLTNRAPAEQQLALERARLQVGLGRAHTPWVVALLHWGREYHERSDPTQQHIAELLHAWGALLVLGAHPHVPQEQRCTAAGATYFSLGNHLFDQASPRTHDGLMVRCCPRPHALSCTPLWTRRRPDSTFPAPWPRPAPPCEIPVPAVPAEWQRHPAARRFLFVQPFRSLGPGRFFALYRSYSKFDREVAVRPAVFQVEGGRARDLWRGTALSWPLRAARLIEVDGKEYLCALHRGDSFLRLDPQTLKRRHAAYLWSGFGFRGTHDPEVLARCAQL